MTENNSLEFEDEQGNEIDINSLNDEVSLENKVLPQSYDLRDYNRSTPVRNQGQEGLCWDFASVASIESNILSQPELSSEYAGEKINDLDISEGGLSWYIHTNLDDPSSPLNNDYINDPKKGGDGGNPYMVAASLISGFGTYPENYLPYSDWRLGYPSTMRFYSDYRLKDFCNLSNDTELIKDRIMENGAVAVTYSCYQSNYKYSDDYVSYYDNGFALTDNNDLGHVVAIVGWDDNFSKEKFHEGCQPETDGAWLCKNSWGDEWGSANNAGYFWMSYETKNTFFSQFIMQSAEEFDNIYQNQFTFNSNYNADIAANVFTANSDEYLTQISVTTGSAMDYTAAVYRLSDNYSSPVDGELLTEFNGSIDFNGVHTAQLPDSVQLNKGDTFSVVIYNREPDNSYFSVQDKSSTEQIHQKGKCYYYDSTEQGEGWFDCADEDFSFGYAEIKAFTQNSMRKADTADLEKAVNTAENLVINQDIDEKIVNKFNSNLENAKAVLNKTDALQYEVNNAYYLLITSINEINNYFYYINNEEDFINYYKQYKSGNIAEISQNIVFNSDLDFSGYDIEFEPIFDDFDSISFSGTVEGNNHVIKNIKFKEDNGHAGLFGKLDGGIISDLNLDGAVVNGENDSGCFAGELKSGKINNCTVKNSKIQSKFNAAGGIAGYVYNGAIENCSVENSEISAAYGAAGIAGDVSETDRIINSTVSGNTVSGLDSVGYIVGGLLSDKFVVNLASEKISFKPYITITDDGCKVTSLCGTITSLTSDDVDITRLEDEYTFPLKNTCVILKIDYKEDYPDDVAFNVNLNGEITVSASFDVDSKEIVLPETIGGLPVTEISPTFYTANADEITSFVIPDSVTKIYNSLFDEMPNIEKVVLGNGITAIPEHMFEYCYNLRQVEFGESVSVIESGAFFGSGIEEITFPETLLEVKEEVFSQCTNLTKAVLPNSLTKIGDSMFSNCLRLNEIVFGNNLKVIGKWAFNNCSSLINIKIPDSVEVIGDGAFIDSPLCKIILGKNIKEIGTNALGFTNNTCEYFKSAKIPGYVINGYASTAAEQYASENGFKFVNLYVDEPDMSDNIFDYDVFKLGDVNLDGVVSVLDATLIQKYIVDMEELNDVQKSNALVSTYREKISVENATFIQKYIAGLESSLNDGGKG